jgi:hypothetical protein
MISSVVTVFTVIVALVIGILGFVVKEIEIADEYNEKVVQDVSSTGKNDKGDEERNA